MRSDLHDPELARAYCGEIIEQVARLQEHILALEQNPGGDDLAAAFRVAHNLKGSGASYGVTLVTEICQPLEDMLEALRGGRLTVTQDVIERLLRHVDLLAEVAKAGAVGQPLAQFADRLRALSPAAVAAPAAARDERRVLVAESSATTRRIIADILRRAECRVWETDDGIEALRLLGKQRCDLLVTGLELKSLSGHALTAAVKTDPILGRVRVIYVTSIATAGRDAPCKPDLIVAKDAQLAQTLPAALDRLADARA